MFDDRQTKEEIIAAASRQNQMLVEALCDVQRRDAEIERLRANELAQRDGIFAVIAAGEAEHKENERLRVENARMREALEELDQHASLGSPPWYVVPDHVIEKARAALVDEQEVTK